VGIEEKPNQSMTAAWITDKQNEIFYITKNMRVV